MANLYLFNKPFHVLSQFTDKSDKATLARFIDVKKVYPAGRLDYDSEGLLLLTDSGALQHRICDPDAKMPKRYWVQVEGDITPEAINALQNGLQLKDGLTRPAKARIIPAPNVGPRTPPIRSRKNVTDSWLELTINEGKNRQVRRMTAHVGFPTLRLIRYSIGPWTLTDIEVGQWQKQTVNTPELQSPAKRSPKTRASTRPEKPRRATSSPKPKSKLKSKSNAKPNSRPRPGA
ncbi:MAG: pseudouridine synthase [Gammaproteobacteria bacterium]|nr:MAG: pseudouridine synthase [Gammaproteobacteria bacterium]